MFDFSKIPSQGLLGLIAQAGGATETNDTSGGPDLSSLLGMLTQMPMFGGEKKPPVVPGTPAEPQATAAPALPVLPGEAAQRGPSVQNPLASALQLFSGNDAQQAASSQLQNTVAETTNQLDTELASSLDSQLADAMVAPETATGFRALLSNPDFKQLLLQTGVRMAQGMTFAESLGGGALAASEAGKQRSALELAEEQRNIDNKRADAEQARKATETANDTKQTDATVGKLAAETKVLTDSLTSGGKTKIKEGDYLKVYTDTVLKLEENAFLADDPDAKFLDPETEGRYLVNSALPVLSRTYGPLKATYATELARLQQDVQADRVTPDKFESRIQEYMVAFGPQATSVLLKQLREAEGAR